MVYTVQIGKFNAQRYYQIITLFMLSSKMMKNQIFKPGHLIIASLICSVLILQSCSKKGLTQEEIIIVDSVLTQIDILEDSVNHAWERMVADDNQKHDYMKRLLLEISYSPENEKVITDSLSFLVDFLHNARYSSNTQLSSSDIDHYDSLTMNISEVILQYAISHPARNEFGLIDELIGDIRHKNEMILLYRVHYDGFVIQRNDLIERFGEKALLRDSTFNETQLPVFQLP